MPPPLRRFVGAPFVNSIVQQVFTKYKYGNLIDTSFLCVTDRFSEESKSGANFETSGTPVGDIRVIDLYGMRYVVLNNREPMRPRQP
jgi:hypothetical protein